MLFEIETDLVEHLSEQPFPLAVTLFGNLKVVFLARNVKIELPIGSHLDYLAGTGQNLNKCVVFD